MLKAVDNPHNGVTFCTGSYGTNRNNDLVDSIHAMKGRIHFAHVRNLKFHSQTNFEESAHLSEDGDFDMYKIMKALYDTGFDGPIRPDHGRMIWGEKAMPSSANNVMVNMLGIRKKLEDNPQNPKIIKTVWGKGYRLD